MMWGCWRFPNWASLLCESRGRQERGSKRLEGRLFLWMSWLWGLQRGRTLFCWGEREIPEKRLNISVSFPFPWPSFVGICQLIIIGFGPHKHKKPYLRSYHHKLERNVVLWINADISRRSWSSSFAWFQGIRRQIECQGSSYCMLVLAIYWVWNFTRLAAKIFLKLMFLRRNPPETGHIILQHPTSVWPSMSL